MPTCTADFPLFVPFPVHMFNHTDRWVTAQATRWNPERPTLMLELGLLKRCFRLAYKHGKLLRVPPFDMLKDAPAREGFFEASQYEAVRRRLPEDLQVAGAIAHTYGWRMKSEILSLERRSSTSRPARCASIPARRRTARGASCI